ncbi:outer membrane beta-barrel protein [Coralloluteibacterium thermophilus]|uniref:Outer membrane beta-barrel protein n=1 Tax=Coralloluteibacterium thermophilum TaxID=2707049 RepID=A0ABV9NHK5_9GAMM
MHRSILPALLLAALPCAAVQAQDFSRSYTYVELQYANAELDNVGDVDFDGPALRGSVAIGQSFYAFGGVRRGSNDDFGLDIDVTQYQLGGGYRLFLSERADLIAEVSRIRTRAKVEDLGRAHGYDTRASVGVRGTLAEWFEGLVKVNYTDGDLYSDWDGDGNFSATVGAHVRFAPNWGLTGEVELGGDSTEYMLGVRYSF